MWKYFKTGIFEYALHNSIPIQFQKEFQVNEFESQKDISEFLNDNNIDKEDIICVVYNDTEHLYEVYMYN